MCGASPGRSNFAAAPNSNIGARGDIASRYAPPSANPVAAVRRSSKSPGPKVRSAEDRSDGAPTCRFRVAVARSTIPKLLNEAN